jgi:formylglycine-generating enzyme required for sulfatase activity
LQHLHKNLWLWLALGLMVTLLSLAAFHFLNGSKAIPPESLTNSLGMEFVRIPAGQFLMGSPPEEKGRQMDEGPQHEVEITQPFAMSVYEVTEEQFARLMGGLPALDKEPGKQASRELPVHNVSWDEAVEFCRRLSELPAEKAAGRTYRLPTEAEWEYACRAGTTTPYTASVAIATDKEGRERDAAQSSLGKVKNNEPNPWGLYDMHGRVREWCSDWYAADYYTHSPLKDPQGPPTGTFRVARGGSWADSAASCRSANRIPLAPEIRLGNGIRVVMIETGVRR